ncbi:adenine nucleotide translocase lysine N-methyltransferase isoform X3 [Paroedura picta]|uniref:adenine nucleotide translocase lysine N-methyltransferase isoform X3 n=1 Tax=Paroedura picta TaxID=143630 RepID=UPI004056B801
MDPEDAEQLASEMRGKTIDGWALLQFATGTGLAAYVVWAGVLMPGFRKVPLKLQVLEAHRRGFRPAIGYELNPWLLRLSSYRAWKAGCYGEVSYRREDLWKVDLSDCGNVTVFLAPSVLPLLERKLLAELPEEARVVAGRFPLPNWASTSTAGDGLNQAWAYDLKAVRAARRDNPEGSSV